MKLYQVNNLNGFIQYPFTEKGLSNAEKYAKSINSIVITIEKEEFVEEESYIIKRIKDYPPISEQLDMIYHYGLDYWKDKIQNIKDKYPKPINVNISEKPIE